MKWWHIVLLLALAAHVGLLAHVAAEYGPEREAELAYAAAPSCGCSPHKESWCPSEDVGKGSCRWAVKVRVVATPLTGGQKGRYVRWAKLEVYRGLGGPNESRAELSRFNVTVNEKTWEAVRRGREVHAEVWRKQITRLRVDGVLFDANVPSTRSAIAFVVYASIVLLVVAAVLVHAFVRARSRALSAQRRSRSEPS